MVPGTRYLSKSSILHNGLKDLPKTTPDAPKEVSVIKPSILEAQAKARIIFTPEELEAARLARLAGLKWLVHLPEKWIPYAELLRLEKPAGTLLLLIPSLWGITMAAYSFTAPLTTTLYVMSLFAVGSLIMRGGGCCINDILDRDLDAKVARTTERPIASGRISVPLALVFTGVQGLAGLVVLLSLPFECFYLGALSLPVIIAYPLFKRFTYYPQAWFSLCFCWGILLAYPAVGAPFDYMVAIPLFFSNWIWGIIYDSVYAHQDKKFDEPAGIKSTALKWGSNTRPILLSLVGVQAGLYAVAGVMNAMGPGFLVTGVWGMTRLYKRIKSVDFDDPKSCWSFFTENTKTGFILWFGMVIDYGLRLLGYL